MVGRPIMAQILPIDAATGFRPICPKRYHARAGILYRGTTTRPQTQDRTPRPRIRPPIGPHTPGPGPQNDPKMEWSTPSIYPKSTGLVVKTCPAGPQKVAQNGPHIGPLRDPSKRGFYPEPRAMVQKGTKRVETDHISSQDLMLCEIPNTRSQLQTQHSKTQHPNTTTQHH